MNEHYQLGLLCLTHLLIGADGDIDDHEKDALSIIRKNENISDETFNRFVKLIADKKEREVFQTSIDLLNQCSLEEKLKIFVLLYKLSEVDGRVHVGEVRLLLYSIKLADIEFDEVVNRAMEAPSLL